MTHVFNSVAELSASMVVGSAWGFQCLLDSPNEAPDKPVDPIAIYILGRFRCLHLDVGLGPSWVGGCSWCRGKSCRVGSLCSSLDSGVKLSQRGAEIIREACQFSPELAAAADVWQEITFEYDAVDTI